jgi:KipI family sensor histidine kinase inhibitor
VITEPESWDLAELTRLIGELPLPDAAPADGAVVEIPVVYDGPDLADVAKLSGLTSDQVIARHSDTEYTVGWLGFAPGFGYLTGLDPALCGVPRLASPRLSVPAGSVAIAGGLAAIYPSASPGGWRLLGRTAARLWDPSREPPSLLTPGMRVRFRVVATASSGPQRGTRAKAGLEPDGDADPDPGAHARPGPGTTRYGGAGQDRHLEVLRPGPLATVQDLGRRGLANLGVPPSGAADAISLRLANRLTGNPPEAAGLEFTLGRASLRCSRASRLAVTGAPAPVTIAAADGQPVDIAFGAAFDVPAGGIVTIGAPVAGLRTYLAVAGGIDTPAVLGSRSSDVHSGIGGGPLRPGTALAVGVPPPVTPGRSASGQPAGSADARWPTTTVPVIGEPACLRLIAGPRHDWFVADALAILCGSPYLVTPASNRTGLRLDGPALLRACERELASEGMVTGALQVPHDGKPILLLADHPTVGGYPVIAVVATADIGLAGQLRPGQRIRFTLAR